MNANLECEFNGIKIDDYEKCDNPPCKAPLITGYRPIGEFKFCSNSLCAVTATGFESNPFANNFLIDFKNKAIVETEPPIKTVTLRTEAEILERYVKGELSKDGFLFFFKTFRSKEERFF